MTRRTTYLMALALAALAPAAARGDDDGFVALFNGKDLSGWVTPDDKSLFAVEGGEIVGRTKGNLKKNEFLVTDKPYGDFVLKAKVKYRNGNSGIQFRSERRPDGVVAGPQADIAAKYWGVLYEEQRRKKILARYPEKEAAKIVREGDWNDMEVAVTGDHVVIHLNGTKVIDFVDPTFDKSGIIALQVHVGPAMEVRFKDIKIKAAK